MSRAAPFLAKGRVLQRHVTTSEPELEQLGVACAALSRVIELERGGLGGSPKNEATVTEGPHRGATARPRSRGSVPAICRFLRPSLLRLASRPEW